MVVVGAFRTDGLGLMEAARTGSQGANECVNDRINDRTNVRLHVRVDIGKESESSGASPGCDYSDYRCGPGPASQTNALRLVGKIGVGGAVKHEGVSSGWGR